MKLQEINIHFQEIVFSCFKGKRQLSYSLGKEKFPFSNLTHSVAGDDIIQTLGLPRPVMIQTPRLSSAGRAGRPVTLWAECALRRGPQNGGLLFGLPFLGFP